MKNEFYGIENKKQRNGTKNKNKLKFTKSSFFPIAHVKPTTTTIDGCFCGMKTACVFHLTIVMPLYGIIIVVDFLHTHIHMPTEILH